MKKAYYREQALERIARDVIIAYDPRLYYGSPAAIPIEDIIEAQGLVLEYQYLRNNGRVLGETIFDDGLTAIYDRENHRYDLLPVKGGTILIDCSLCEEEASTGRLRFTCAHELGHWLLHKKQFSGTGENAALRSGDEGDNTLEVQANLLGSILLLPLPQVKRCFYQLRSGRTNQQLVTDLSGIQTGHAHSVGEPQPAVKNFHVLFSKKRTEKARRYVKNQFPALSAVRQGPYRGYPQWCGAVSVQAVCAAQSGTP